MGIEQGYVFKQVCNFIIKFMIYVLRSECMLAICLHSRFSILMAVMKLILSSHPPALSLSQEVLQLRCVGWSMNPILMSILGNTLLEKVLWSGNVITLDCQNGQGITNEWCLFAMLFNKTIPSYLGVTNYLRDLCDV